MKKLVFLSIICLFLSSCASIRVYKQTSQTNIKPSVKKEMIENEQKRIKEKRELNKLHRERLRKVWKMQKKRLS